MFIKNKQRAGLQALGKKKDLIQTSVRKAEPESCPEYIHSRPKADAIYLKQTPTRLRANPKQIQSQNLLLGCV